MARAYYVWALLLLLAAPGLQATFTGCANSVDPAMCAVLFDLWTAFGGISFFGPGKWFDQTTNDICDTSSDIWGAFYCFEVYQWWTPGTYRLGCVSRMTACALACERAPEFFVYSGGNMHCEGGSNSAGPYRVGTLPATVALPPALFTLPSMFDMSVTEE